MFDVLVDELRTHSTEWLESRRREVIGAQRELHAEELAIVRVLDERGRIDASMGSAGESSRVVRDKVETARALEVLPAIGEVALAGGFSDEQLSSVTRLADEESDREWARRGPQTDPVELERLARNANKPTAEDSRARFAAREFRMWRGRDKSMLQVRGQLPDDLGAAFEARIVAETEKMKPVKGQPWAPFEQRAADALVALCTQGPADADDTPSLAVQPNLQVAIPREGPAHIAGIPIADSLLEQLRANATIEMVLFDDDGTLLGIGRRTSAISPKLRRAVLLRDTQCRVPGCSRRRGLEVHHLLPRTWGGLDELANLACVCPAHHRLLIPNGLLALIGNPNLPDGLQLVTAPRGPPLLV
jgi:hypothetical protein